MKKFIIAWVLGGLFSVSLMGLHQDWLGREGYVEYISTHWVDIPWAVWLIPLVTSLVTLFSLRPRSRADVLGLVQFTPKWLAFRLGMLKDMYVPRAVEDIVTATLDAIDYPGERGKHGLP